MRRIRGTTVVLAALAALTGTACGGGARSPVLAPSSTTATTSAALTTSATTSSDTNATALNSATHAPATVDAASAVMRVTMGRCDRQAACNNVGTNRRFGDRDACANEIGHDVVATLSSEECPSGVDADKLSTCLSDLQSEPCLDRATSAEGPASCGRERLCVPTSSVDEGKQG